MKFEDQIGQEAFEKGQELANKANDEFDKIKELELVKDEQNSDNDAEFGTPAIVQKLSFDTHDAKVRHSNLVNEAARHIGKIASDSAEADSLQ